MRTQYSLHSDCKVFNIRSQENIKLSVMLGDMQIYTLMMFNSLKLASHAMFIYVLEHNLKVTGASRRICTDL